MQQNAASGDASSRISGGAAASLRTVDITQVGGITHIHWPSRCLTGRHASLSAVALPFFHAVFLAVMLPYRPSRWFSGRHVTFLAITLPSWPSRYLLAVTLSYWPTYRPDITALVDWA